MKKVQIFTAAAILAAAAFLIYQKTAQASGTGKSAKICSAVVPGNWRNDLPVPPQWTGSDCGVWAASIGATLHQLGCLTNDSVNYGPGSGTTPMPNCGW